MMFILPIMIAIQLHTADPGPVIRITPAGQYSGDTFIINGGYWIERSGAYEMAIGPCPEDRPGCCVAHFIKVKKR